MSSIPASAEAMPTTDEAATLLTLEALTVRLAGVPVVDAVSLAVRAG